MSDHKIDRQTRNRLLFSEPDTPQWRPSPTHRSQTTATTFDLTTAKDLLRSNFLTASLNTSAPLHIIEEIIDLLKPYPEITVTFHATVKNTADPEHTVRLETIEFTSVEPLPRDFIFNATRNYGMNPGADYSSETNTLTFNID